MIIRLYLILSIISVSISRLTYAYSENDNISKIEAFVKKQMIAGKIPGMALVILDNNKIIYKKGFGYADLKIKRPVTSNTLFELGSTSKAFTALGILLLEEKGLINLNDPVDKYIPWLKMKYKGQEYSPTIEQFLHHTSGVPFKTIGKIPISKDPEALEKTVKTLLEQELEYKPGTKFQYATINYDVIGLIIQKVSKISYEEFMYKNILQPLNLNNTYLFRNESVKHDLATGYKIGFKQSLKYIAPIYQGNVPAGYFITNAEDLGKWIKIQLNNVNLNESYTKLIRKSHIPDTNINSSYCLGWFFQKSICEYDNGGTNPNYSSYIAFNPDKNIGVGVLANINSNYTKEICDGVLNICQGLKPSISVNNDFNQKLDNLSTILLYFTTPILFLILWLIIKNIYRTKIKFNLRKPRNIILFIGPTILLAVCFYFLYNIPKLIGYDVPWAFVYVWAPVTFMYATSIIFLLGIGIYFTILIKSVSK